MIWYKAFHFKDANRNPINLQNVIKVASDTYFYSIKAGEFTAITIFLMNYRRYKYFQSI